MIRVSPNFSFSETCHPSYTVDETMPNVVLHYYQPENGLTKICIQVGYSNHHKASSRSASEQF